KTACLPSLTVRDDSYRAGQAIATPEGSGVVRAIFNGRPTKVNQACPPRTSVSERVTRSRPSIGLSGADIILLDEHHRTGRVAAQPIGRAPQAGLRHEITRTAQDEEFGFFLFRASKDRIGRMPLAQNRRQMYATRSSEIHSSFQSFLQMTAGLFLDAFGEA